MIPFWIYWREPHPKRERAFFETLSNTLRRPIRPSLPWPQNYSPDKPGTAKTLAFYAHGNDMENIEYALQGTPCECVYENGLTYIESQLQERFPEDSDLVDMQVNSYLGIPLYAKEGQKIGHICVLGSKAVGEHAQSEDYLRMFASRAAAELERIRADRALLHQRQQLSSMVDEQTVELRNAKELAEQANRAKTEFLARMSHELKTPLNAIHGFTQLMREETAGELNAVYKEYVESTLTASHHLKNIINDLLDFSVIEIGKLKIKIVSCPIKAVLDECISMVATRASENNIQIQYSDDAQTKLAVLADSSRLKEIVINLLTNAIKYNLEEGQIILNIQPVDNQYVRVSVTDTGPGISRLEQARVFNEFERLSADQDCIEGTGIGLALTRRLAEHMDGRVGLDSKLGQGSTFWFELPAAKL